MPFVPLAWLPQKEPEAPLRSARLHAGLAPGEAETSSSLSSNCDQGHGGNTGFLLILCTRWDGRQFGGRLTAECRERGSSSFVV